jgi:two-component system chemotaxis response regulator CheB
MAAKMCRDASTRAGGPPTLDPTVPVCFHDSDAVGLSRSPPVNGSSNGEPGCDAPPVVVVGTSAGGIGVTRSIVAELPADLGAAVLVVMHLPPTHSSRLAAILDRHATLPVGDAVDGEELRPGRIYVATPDRHLLVGRRRVHLTAAPRENGSRPAIDPLFRSAARHHGARTVGVVLTGMLDDGSAGLLAIGQAGGVTVVQDPEEAPFPAMPRSAMETATPDHVVPTAELAATIAAAVELVATRPAPLADEELEEDSGIEDVPTARLTGLTCPDCGGVLWNEGPDQRDFRCRTGHRFAAESLYARHTSAVEGALWAGVRALVEQADLAEQLALTMERRANSSAAELFRRRAVDARHHADLLRRDTLGAGAAQPAAFEAARD